MVALAVSVEVFSDSVELEVVLELELLVVEEVGDKAGLLVSVLVLSELLATAHTTPLTAIKAMITIATVLFMLTLLNW